MDSFLSSDSQTAPVDHDYTINYNLSIKADFYPETEPTYDHIEEGHQEILDLWTHDSLDICFNHDPESNIVSSREERKEQKALCGLLDSDHFLNDEAPSDSEDH